MCRCGFGLNKDQKAEPLLAVSSVVSLGADAEAYGGAGQTH